MPTYEYVCTNCGRKVEVVQSFSDPPLQTCEVCGGNLRKVFHPVAIQFKGGGFYSSDRRAAQPGRPKEPAKKDGTGEGGSESKTGTTTDKPAAAKSAESSAASASTTPAKSASEKSA